MKKNKGILSLILTAVLVVLLGFTVLVGFGKTGTGAMKNIKLGLDLAGGVSITYQAKEENPSAEDMSDTQYKLQQRVQNYSSEAEVYQEGGNRVCILFQEKWSRNFTSRTKEICHEIQEKTKIGRAHV